MLQLVIALNPIAIVGVILQASIFLLPSNVQDFKLDN